jgi:membrane-associated phospholipid phosphatase
LNTEENPVLIKFKEYALIGLKLNTTMFLSIILIGINILQAQTDSLGTNIRTSLTSMLLPLSLITAGSAISGSAFEHDLQRDIGNSIGNDFDCPLDDYIVFVPAAEVFVFDLLGIKAKNGFFDRAKYFAIANLSSQAIVQTLKYTTDKARPNGEDRLSFPSNHTNVAFTNATVLWYEYRQSNALIAYSGFAFATATGVLRIMNGHHWTGDVLAGAGIGMLCADLVYRFEPLKHWNPFGSGSRSTAAVIPVSSGGVVGLSLTVQF